MEYTAQANPLAGLLGLAMLLIFVAVIFYLFFKQTRKYNRILQRFALEQAFTLVTDRFTLNNLETEIKDFQIFKDYTIRLPMAAYKQEGEKKIWVLKFYTPRYYFGAGASLNFFGVYIPHTTNNLPSFALHVSEGEQLEKFNTFWVTKTNPHDNNLKPTHLESLKGYSLRTNDLSITLPLINGKIAPFLLSANSGHEPRMIDSNGNSLLYFFSYFIGSNQKVSTEELTLLYQEVKDLRLFS